jgi:GrpB-like predicted nucleotidyltransferase (UPF0157 family)
MQIIRFDEETSIPLRAHGSLGKVGPVAVVAESARVAVFHLPPGGAVGRHRAAAPQLFGVVAGGGWVSGDDGKRRPIACGYGALWDVGELHEVTTETGLTAICIEGDFETLAMAVTQVIEVVEPDPDWPTWFERVSAHVWPVVADLALRIEHVGSTSVPALAAKPIIDMDVVVPEEERVAAVIDRLASIGYQWRGDLGVEGRQAFRPPSEPVLPRHHLYLVVENNKAHVDHWLFRETLGGDPEVRERYERLKRHNQELAGGDMDVYVAAKAAFVADVLRRARDERGLPAAQYWEPDIEEPPSA